jgi:hypothetical protein
MALEILCLPNAQNSGSRHIKIHWPIADTKLGVIAGEAVMVDDAAMATPVGFHWRADYCSCRCAFDPQARFS